MRTVFFVSHPEVRIDPETPVTKWNLSEAGVRRMQAFAAGPFISGVRHVVSSAETKAVEAAALLAQSLGLAPQILIGLGENDRSATGYMPADLFEAAADQFFTHPERSFRGWETALAAQTRIVEAVTAAILSAPRGDVAIISHGAVGTLLKCKLKGIPITRQEDQRRQGNYYSFDAESSESSHWRLRCDWTPIEPF